MRSVQRKESDIVTREAEKPIDFSRIRTAALNSLPAILHRWLPDGKREGHEWVSRNPRRGDRTPGSFKVNMNTGRWSDFATGDAGGDLISLAAYLFGLSQIEAAKKMSVMLGLGGCGHE